MASGFTRHLRAGSLGRRCLTDRSSDHNLPVNENSPTFPETPADPPRTFESAAQAAIGGTSAGSGEGTPPGSQGANVAQWARERGALIPDSAVDELPLVSNSTSEHEVHYRPADDRAVKRTWAGFYGQIPTPENCRLGRKNATPAEYLQRMALQNAVFGGDLQLEGVTVSDKPSMIIGQPPGEASMVISQPWYPKEGIATNEAIRELLEGEGFREAPQSYFGWYREADGVVIVDAKPDNFILTSAGVVPIDLQMSVFSPEEMAAAGLTNR